MTMRLLDPGGQRHSVERCLAPRVTGFEELKMGLLTNGKHNADVLLRETAALFAARQGCGEGLFHDKRNAGVPCDPAHLRALADASDFLITAVGD